MTKATRASSEPATTPRFLQLFSVFPSAVSDSLSAAFDPAMVGEAGENKRQRERCRSAEAQYGTPVRATV
jgi:hypothetical protein